MLLPVEEKNLQADFWLLVRNSNCGVDVGVRFVKSKLINIGSMCISIVLMVVIITWEAKNNFGKAK